MLLQSPEKRKTQKVRQRKSGGGIYIDRERGGGREGGERGEEREREGGRGGREGGRGERERESRHIHNMASRRAGVGGQIKSSRTPAHNTAIVFSVGVIYRTELGTRLWLCLTAVACEK